MSDREVLEKAIQKAIDNGWIIDNKRFLGPMNVYHALDWYEDNELNFIYRHDFAKAFWGEDKRGFGHYSINANGEGSVTGCAAWEYYLQQMVIAEDQIKYLRDNI